MWSGATGTLIRAWDGEWPDGLFGHWVMPVPDLSGDGLADVIIAAPHGTIDGKMRGVVVARSPKTGAELWKHGETATEVENFGWDLTLAGDDDGDGRTDLFVGAPAFDDGRVYLLSGKDGTVLRTYAPQKEGGSFGWYLGRVDDLDGDGRRDLAVGGPFAADAAGTKLGGVWVLSSRTGRELYHWKGTDQRGGFGGVVAPLGDLDGDGKGEIAVAAPATEDQTRTLPGEVHVYSGATGKELRHWSGSQSGEEFGRMVVAAGDLDADGVEDLAIGAPWHRRKTADRVGRVELRSGRSGEVLSELFGDEAECWFGWHITRAPDPDGHGRPALLIGSLYHPVDGKGAVGVLDLYVLRRGRKTRIKGR
ncbi:MAG TPA: FG-GAP-like repeat-containing protein [Candidatus Binatia bacterium]|nr:FG-GAP-like repeat-containing protein [Candidatus Binatia bacterium]